MQLKIVPLVFFVNLLIFTSCKTPNQAQSTNNGTEMSTERIIGIVHKSESCGFFIEVTLGSEIVRYLPENLEEKFRVEGMKLKFGQKPSNKKLDKECKEFNPVLISDVDAMR